MKKAIAEYEQIAGAKVNFDKSEGLQFDAWTGSDTLPGPFCWSGGPVHILGCGLGLTSNWRLSLKGRVEACTVYIFPMILYRLSVLLLPRAHRLALE